MTKRLAHSGVNVNAHLGDVLGAARVRLVLQPLRGGEPLVPGAAVRVPPPHVRFPQIPERHVELLHRHLTNLCLTDKCLCRRNVIQVGLERCTVLEEFKHCKFRMLEVF